MTDRHRYGLAPLSLLGTEPIDVVRAAADAGFDFVGLRVRPVTAEEVDYNLLPGSRRLDEVRTALTSVGIPVGDIEFLLLDGTVDRETWLPMLEAGGLLGATSLTVAGGDANNARLTDTLSELAEDARQFGIVPALEPISYQDVRSIPAATSIARKAGATVLVDALHVTRFGGTRQELHDAAGLVSMLQLCDGPFTAPDDRDGLVEESRAHRLVPLEGDFDLADAVRALRDDVAVSVEVPNPMAQELGPVKYARRLLEAGWAVVEDAGPGTLSPLSPGSDADADQVRPQSRWPRP